MKSNMVKVYVAFRSGCLGNNILEAYYPFLANIIWKENITVIDELQIRAEFERKYKIPVPISFIREVLGVGIRNESIIDNRGRYVVQKEKISQYKFDSIPFENKWAQMNESFKHFCKKNDYSVSEYNIDERILDSINQQDEDIILNEDLEVPQESDSFDFAWHEFLTTAAKDSPEIFDFIVAISASNIMKQAVFFTGDGRETFRGLNVYLDSPYVFALLGMDSLERKESCKYLFDRMLEAGCNVQIFDHNLNEINGILSRAGSWATSPHYSLDKANNAARYFHDLQMDEQLIAEYCESVEDKLSKLGMTIKKTDYDTYEDKFQENEKQIFKMIEEKYQKYGKLINEDIRNSILVDVRSIIMVYRERRGQTSTRIQSSRDILITLNNVVADVSKKYESNQSNDAGHIPAGISSDVFGAVLWLFSPADLMQYQKKQLLADCYIALRPNRTMLKKYVESLERARSAGEIDDKKYLFLRSHSVVNDALMNVTKGNYARFNDRTYLEVYDEIQAISEKKYYDELVSHKLTQEELYKLQQEKDEQNRKAETERLEKEKKIDELANEVGNLKSSMEQKEKIEFEKKVNQLGWLWTGSLIGLPYLILMAILQISISVYTDFSLFSILNVFALVLLTLIFGYLEKKGKACCFKWAEKHLRKKLNK
ncbi:MAG: hypothetical protein CVU90_15760 [Firmicutes bacterium HGW-Firmicutes-15]|jgi:tetrahydromethanopterin S-methyltransferase subunit G|nr:MAG: hypothetical protein CVV46_09415 [Spirochaetae bacterium HGW-Spirochaetae-2]PKM75801.1 MAG: hypothetical protein CVU90_15760 [Firmicutes bacterium HGW-Firmicutes-15]